MIYIGYKQLLVVDEKPSVLICYSLLIAGRLRDGDSVDDQIDKLIIHKFINELFIWFRAEQIDTNGRRKLPARNFLRIFATKVAQK